MADEWLCAFEIAIPVKSLNTCTHDDSFVLFTVQQLHEEPPEKLSQQSGRHFSTVLAASFLLNEMQTNFSHTCLDIKVSGVSKLLTGTVCMESDKFSILLMFDFTGRYHI